MEATTVLYSIIAAIVALTIAVLFYIKSLKQGERLSYILTTLRFISIFAMLLLLINPKTKQEEITQQKPKLAVAIDASTSIQTSDQQIVNSFYQQLQNDDQLNGKFDISFFSFGEDFAPLDSLKFTERQTNISKPLNQIEKLQQNRQTAVLLVTDGNQTIGIDYGYLKPPFEVYPVVVGDTTRYEDVSIQKVFANKYSYLDNQFPVEVVSSYDGEKTVRNRLEVYLDGKRVYSEQLNFSPTNNTVRSNFFLPASKVGVHEYQVSIRALENEKNTANNMNSFVVEVIDEQAQILILTSFYHPDIAGFKKAINSSKQRNAEVVLITEPFDIDSFNAVLLYQPTQAFRTAIEEINVQKMPCLLVTGAQTDWNFLNSIQNDFRKAFLNQTELYTPQFNQTFQTFNFTDIGFNNYPPLKDMYGDVVFNVEIDVLLYQQIGSFATNQAMLAFYEVANQRKAVLFGENTWQWRMQDNLQNGSFNQYDSFVAKIFQFLTALQKTERLVVNAESVYNINTNLKIESRYLNKNYEPDANAVLWLNLTNTSTNEEQKIPFRFNGNQYEVDISYLKEGAYSYTVKVENESIASSGVFRVLDFDIEQQLQRANFDKLQNLAKQSGGYISLIKDYSIILEELKSSDKFKPKSILEVRIKPLIEWQWLLALIVLSLTIEWLLRKYNGLI
ncbi:hypothetical protein KH5_17410 [Urechidicola sp. KH5]